MGAHADGASVGRSARRRGITVAPTGRMFHAGAAPGRSVIPCSGHADRYLRSRGTTPAATPPTLVGYREPAGRWVLAATVLGSSVGFLDATVVNIALPSIGRDLGAGATGLTWTVNGYSLTLAAFVLTAGTAGDRFGRRRVFMIGLAWFGVTSLLCALATSTGMLVVLRALQGVGAALVTPGALAIIQSSFVPDDRARAVGAWSGLAGIAGAVGPFLGGWLVDVGTWRWIFLLNVPVVAAVLLITARHVPEFHHLGSAGRFDLAGAGLAAVGLGGLTYGLSPGRHRGRARSPSRPGWPSASSLSWPSSSSTASATRCSPWTSSGRPCSA